MINLDISVVLDSARLSVVMISPELHAHKLNELAQLTGKGPNNLDRWLINDRGEKYLAGHSWAWIAMDFKALFSNEAFVMMGLSRDEYAAAIDNSIWNVVIMQNNSNYQPLNDNWQPTLLKHGLIELIETEQG